MSSVVVTMKARQGDAHEAAIWADSSANAPMQSSRPHAATQFSGVACAPSAVSASRNPGSANCAGPSDPACRLRPAVLVFAMERSAAGLLSAAGPLSAPSARARPAMFCWGDCW